MKARYKEGETVWVVNISVSNSLIDIQAEQCVIKWVAYRENGEAVYWFKNVIMGLVSEPFLVGLDRNGELYWFLTQATTKIQEKIREGYSSFEVVVNYDKQHGRSLRDIEYKDLQK